MGRLAARRSTLLVSAVAALFCGNAACGGASEAAPRRPPAEAPVTETAEPVAEVPTDRPDPSDEELAVAAHVLNRFAFGPRPGQVDEVARVGPRAWLDRQLEMGGPVRGRRVVTHWPGLTPEQR